MPRRFDSLDRPPADTFDESETDVTAWDPRDERLTPRDGRRCPEWVTRSASISGEAVGSGRGDENSAGLVFVGAPTGSGRRCSVI